MAEPRMLELAKELLERSRKGEVNWEDAHSGAFKVRFPDISLVVFRLSGTDYLLHLENEKGQVINRIYGYLGTPEYEILQEMYDLARRGSLDFESSIDKAFEYLRRG